MVRVLALPLPQHEPPLQPPTVPGQSGLLLCQKAFVARGGGSPLPQPPHRPRPHPPDPNLRGGPLRPQYPLLRGHEHPVAQSPKVGHQRLFIDPDCHPLPGSLSPPHCSILQVQAPLGRPTLRMRPPDPEPGHRKAPRFFPLHVGVQSARLVPAPHQRPLFGLSPAELAYPSPRTPVKKAPPNGRPGTSYDPTGRRTFSLPDHPSRPPPPPTPTSLRPNS